MSEPLKIDLSGIEAMWSKSGRQICADCGFDFDKREFGDEEEHDIPLQMFRGKGKKTEMLTLCWTCAEKRMKANTPEISLGHCCVCGGKDGTRNILNLPFKSPTPGRGWGCVVCNQPPNGAMAIVCDKCLESVRNCGQDPLFGLKNVCTGYPAKDGRTPITEFKKEHFDHDLRYHQDQRPTN